MSLISTESKKLSGWKIIEASLMSFNKSAWFMNVMLIKCNQGAE